MKAFSPLTIATRLHSIQLEKAKLAAEEEQLKEVLFESLKRQGVKSVRLTNGVMYLRSYRRTLKPIRGKEDQAWQWAADHNCLKIDTSKSLKVLGRELHLPEFFRIDPSEYLVVRRPGQLT